MRASIRIDGERAQQKLAANHYLIVEMPPGERLIYGDKKGEAKTYRIEAGKTYYFRIEPRWALVRARFVVFPIPPEIAKPELAVLEPEKP